MKGTIEERIKQVFVNTLKVEPHQFRDDLTIGDIPEWDSLGHVNLLQGVESEFQIAFDVGDAIEMESVGDIISTVEKYLN